MREDDSNFLRGKTTERVFWSNRSFRLKNAQPRVIKEKSSGDVFPLLSRGGRHRLASSLFLRSILMHLFARSVHTEGVSSSTRDFISLSLFNSMMMISHVYSFVLFIRRDEENKKQNYPQKKKRITNSHQLLSSSNGHGFGNKEKRACDDDDDDVFFVLLVGCARGTLVDVVFFFIEEDKRE